MSAFSAPYHRTISPNEERLVNDALSFLSVYELLLLRLLLSQLLVFVRQTNRAQTLNSTQQTPTPLPHRKKWQTIKLSQCTPINVPSSIACRRKKFVEGAGIMRTLDSEYTLGVWCGGCEHRTVAIKHGFRAQCGRSVWAACENIYHYLSRPQSPRCHRGCSGTINFPPHTMRTHYRRSANLLGRGVLHIIASSGKVARRTALGARLRARVTLHKLWWGGGSVVGCWLVAWILMSLRPECLAKTIYGTEKGKTFELINPLYCKSYSPISWNENKKNNDEGIWEAV